jgi:hypothetical protein
MLDFSCPVCKTKYHADESQIGKRVRCIKPGCEEVITVAWQDGRYTTSNQQIQTKSEQRSKSVFVEPLRNLGVVFARPKWKRGIIFAVIVVLLVGIGFAWHNSGADKEASKPSSDNVVSQSSGNVEVTSAATEPVEQSSQLSPNNQATEPPKIYYPTPTTHRALKAQAPSAQETPFPANSVPTGTRLIEDQATSGRGLLKAINGTSLDSFVIVMVANTQERVRVISVKAQDSFMLEDISPGNYNVFFATGLDWDSYDERFNRQGSYFEFGKALSFEEDNHSYERHTITLNPVPNGNVRSRPISEAEFHRLTGKH